MKIVYTPSADRKLRSVLFSEVDYDIVASEQTDLVVAGSTVDSTVDDRSITTHTGATYDKHYDIAIIETVPGCLRSPGVLQSLDIGIASVSSNSRVDRVSDGIARIEYQQNQLTKQISLDLTRTVGGSVVVQNGYIDDSLAKHSSDAVDTAIDGLTPSVAKPLFSTLDHATPTYTRSVNSWLAGIDTTCISVWVSTAAGKFPVAAITTLCGVTANHVAQYFPIGTQIRFLTADGTTVITRTVTGGQRVGATDLYVVKWGVALPETVVPCEVLPANALDYLPSLADFKVPAVMIDQNRHAIIADYLVNNSYDVATFSSPDDATRLSFYTQLESGDSGGPKFIIQNGKLALAAVATAPTYGPDIIDLHSGLASALTTLSGGSLTDADLSDFTDFS